jgi:hypothetical protein
MFRMNESTMAFLVVAGALAIFVIAVVLAVAPHLAEAFTLMPR